MISIEYQGGTPDEPSLLVCDTCHKTIWDGDAVDIEYLVGVLQAHGYECRNKVVVEHKYCGVCGDPLYRVGTGTPQCARCNLTIPEALQTTHVLDWITYANYTFKPACTCGWESSVTYPLEADARVAWERHPKSRRTRLQAVPDGE